MEYSDAIALLVETTEMLQLLLDIISVEAQKLGLSINPDKTKSLARVKSDKNIAKTNIALKIGDDPVEQMDDFVYSDVSSTADRVQRGK